MDSPPEVVFALDISSITYPSKSSSLCCCVFDLRVDCRTDARLGSLFITSSNLSIALCTEFLFSATYSLQHSTVTPPTSGGSTWLVVVIFFVVWLRLIDTVIFTRRNIVINPSISTWQTLAFRSLSFYLCSKKTRIYWLLVQSSL